MIEVGGHGYQNFLNAEMDDGRLFREHPEWFAQDASGNARRRRDGCCAPPTPRPSKRWNRGTRLPRTASGDRDLRLLAARRGQVVHVQAAAIWAARRRARPSWSREWPDPQKQAAYRPPGVHRLFQLPRAAGEGDHRPDRARRFLPDRPVLRGADQRPRQSANSKYAAALQAWTKSFSGDISIYSYYRKYAWHSLPTLIPHYMQNDLRYYLQAAGPGHLDLCRAGRLVHL